MKLKTFKGIDEGTGCWLYMIRCGNNALYTGVTVNYIRRWTEHKSGQGARYIASHGYVEPVFLQKFDTKGLAMKEENFIKKQEKMYKEELIKSPLNILAEEKKKW